MAFDEDQQREIDARVYDIVDEKFEAFKVDLKETLTRIEAAASKPKTCDDHGDQCKATAALDRRVQAIEIKGDTTRDNLSRWLGLLAVAISIIGGAYTISQKGSDNTQPPTINVYVPVAGTATSATKP